jgi:hypothetical protein
MPIDQITSASIENASIAQVDLATGVAGTGPAFRAKMSGTQSPTANTWTKVQMNSEDWDTASCYDPTTNYRFTPNVAGYYLINVSAWNQNANTGYRIDTAIYKNGSTYVIFAGPANSVSYGNGKGSDLVYLNGTTDYVECYALVNPASVVYDGVFSGALVRAA